MTNEYKNIGIGGELYLSGTTTTDNSLTQLLVKDTNGQLKLRDASTISGFFTGNTSGSCITDLYISNLYGCSPITVHDNIVLTTGKTINSTNGGGQIDLDYQGIPNSIFISSDNGAWNESAIWLTPTQIELSTSGQTSTVGINTSGKFRTNVRGIEMGVTGTRVLTSDSSLNGYNTVGVGDGYGSIISSNSSYMLSAVTNSVIIGGGNITASTSDTVYVDRFNIKTIGSGTSITNLGIDSSGNVVSGTTGGSTPALSAVTAVGSTTTTDIEITDFTKGVILRSPDNTRWRITVDNSGALITTSI